MYLRLPPAAEVDCVAERDVYRSLDGKSGLHARAITTHYDKQYALNAVHSTGLIRLTGLEEKFSGTTTPALCYARRHISVPRRCRAQNIGAERQTGEIDGDGTVPHDSGIAPGKTGSVVDQFSLTHFDHQGASMTEVQDVMAVSKYALAKIAQKADWGDA